MAFPLIPAIAILLTLALTAYKFLIHPLFISPLSRIQSAHWSAPLSPFWMLSIRFRMLENRTLHAAHLKLGPIIRIGPNELSVNDLHGVRTVYGGGFEKGDWYSLFNNYGEPNLFSTPHTRPHSTRKRMLSNIYSKSTIQSSIPLHDQSHHLIFNRLLPILSSPEASTSIDILEIYYATTMDFITGYLFGISSSTNFLQDPVYRKHWLKLYYARHVYPFFPQELPRLTSFMKMIGVDLVPKFVEAANLELEDWCLAHCRKAFSWLKIDDGEKRALDEPVVLSAMMSGIEKEEKLKGKESVLAENLLKERELGIASEMLDQLAAGYETSGITLTYMTYHLSQNLNLQALLREELLTLGPSLSLTSSPTTLPDHKTIAALPLLHAILMESLRLNAPIPGNEPRVSPFPSCTINGYEVPGGTRIGAQGHSVHRNASVYERPEEWDYTRWLDGDGDAKEGKEEEGGSKERDRNFWAFGSGGRMCIGSNFAVQEIKLVVAAIYTNFTTHIVNDEGIEQEDAYIAGPVSNRFLVRFEPVA